MLYARSSALWIEDQARAMYRRVLSGWAMDALTLRRKGLDRPCARKGSRRHALMPGETGGPLDDRRWTPAGAEAAWWSAGPVR